MECKKDKTDILLEVIRREMVSFIEDGSEKCEGNINKGDEAEKTVHDCLDSSEISSSNIYERKESFTSRNAILSSTNISRIDSDIQQLQNNLDENCKLLQSIGERFESINFGYLKNRIKDLNLNESNTQSIKAIVNDLKHTFDEKYIQNQLSSLTDKVSSNFRNHPGEFGDIPEISEFFRTCTRLEHVLQKLRQQRGYCMNLQERMTRVAEASYDRVNEIQQIVSREENKILQYENI